MKAAPSARSPQLRLFILPTLMMLAVALSGCQAIRAVLYVFTPASKGRWVRAECEDLSRGKRVLVLVYADQNIQYRHEQLARYNTAAFVASELQSRLQVDVVEPFAVENFQAANINWTNQPLNKIGQRFRAEYILYIELLEFSTAVEGSGELLRGHMEANVRLYTVGETSRQLWQGDIRVFYPPDAPEVADLGVAQRIRDETLRLFAETLVKRFYGHYEPV